MSADTPDSAADRTEVGSVRRFLDHYDRLSRLNEGVLALANGAPLTATAVRTLLAGYDVYRAEAYAAREEQPAPACGAKSQPVGTYTCDRAAGHDGDHGAGTAVRYQWPEYAVVEHSAGGHVGHTAVYVRDVLTNPGATEADMRAGCVCRAAADGRGGGVMKPDDAAIREAHRAGWEAAMNTLNPSQRSPYPGMPPLRNGMRAPLPEGIRTTEDLAIAMRRLRNWAGMPSLRELGEREPAFADRSLNDAFGQPDLLHAFVKACGAQDDWIWWFKAWSTALDNSRRGEN